MDNNNSGGHTALVRQLLAAADGIDPELTNLEFMSPVFAAHAEIMRKAAAALNAHDDLVKALEEILPAYRAAIGLHDPNTHTSLTVEAHNALAKARSYLFHPPIRGGSVSEPISHLAGGKQVSDPSADARDAANYRWIIDVARKTGATVRFVNAGRYLCVGAGIMDESIVDDLENIAVQLAALVPNPEKPNWMGALTNGNEADADCLQSAYESVRGALDKARS